MARTWYEEKLFPRDLGVFDCTVADLTRSRVLPKQDGTTNQWYNVVINDMNVTKQRFDPSTSSSCTWLSTCSGGLNTVAFTEHSAQWVTDLTTRKKKDVPAGNGYIADSNLSRQVVSWHRDLVGPFKSQSGRAGHFFRGAR